MEDLLLDILFVSTAFIIGRLSASVKITGFRTKVVSERERTGFFSRSS